ncbi:hypothetical protein cypCar_00020126, partial [Cyprinus carpio]
LWFRVILLACEVGFYKPVAGDQLCGKCPLHSHSETRAALTCPCDASFYRSSTDPPASPCTRPPSAPVNIISSVNGTSVSLEWGSPLDTGGRSDVIYDVLCQKCDKDGTQCEDCRVGARGANGVGNGNGGAADTNGAVSGTVGGGGGSGVNGVVVARTGAALVRFIPQQMGLTEAWVTVLNLAAHSNYTFRIVALNGVTHLSNEPPQSVMVNITTNQAAPSQVMAIRQENASQNSVTLFWHEPAQPNGVILEYDIKYYEKDNEQQIYATVKSKNTSAKVSGLKPGTSYIFQIRARTSAGCGRFSQSVEIQTGKAISFPEARFYIDPHTYEDPCQAVHEFAREIEASRIKIEKIIGSDLHHLSNLLKSCSCAFSCISLCFCILYQGKPVMIITEYMENGSLDSFLRRHDGQFTIIQLVGILRGIAAGMTYLADLGYVHRDLAARNVLVNSNLGGKIPIRWTAPEAIAYRKFSSSSDVWSYGVVMWEVMSYGERPYWNLTNRDVIKSVEEGYRLPAPMGCPGALHTLMLDCWQKDRNERPKFCQIITVLDKLIRNPTNLKSVETLCRLVLNSPLMNRSIPDFTICRSVSEWLDTIKMGRYKDHFAAGGYLTLGHVMSMKQHDMQRLGVTLMGHQKKIMTSVQLMRAQVLNQSVPSVHI